MTRIDAWYLLLGVDFRSCTLLHGAEEIARVPFLDFDTRYEVHCRDGDQEYRVCIACHSTPHRPDFLAIEPVLEARGLLVRGKVGCAECRMARAADILNTGLDELARDPFFLRQCPANPP